MLACATGSCRPGSGAIVLEARSGRVVDRESREPIPEADVYQVYWGRGVAGEPRPAYALRWNLANAEGEFAFGEKLSSEPRSWALETDAAEYGFYHPEYGLVRLGRPESDGPVVLAGKRLDPARRQAEQLSLCGSRPPDEVTAHVARSHCAHRKR